MIIEDEKLLADSIKIMLKRQDYEVECVYDGKTGVEYAELGVYDLLILDVTDDELAAWGLATPELTVTINYTVTEFGSDSSEEKEEVSLVFHLNNESFPQITVEIYRHDGSNCFVVLNGEKLGFVSRSSVVDLIEAIHQIVLG